MQLENLDGMVYPQNFNQMNYAPPQSYNFQNPRYSLPPESLKPILQKKTMASYDNIVGDPKVISIVCDIVWKKTDCCGGKTKKSEQPPPIQITIPIDYSVKDLRKEVGKIINYKIFSFKLSGCKLRDDDLVGPLIAGYTSVFPVRFTAMVLFGCCEC